MRSRRSSRCSGVASSPLNVGSPGNTVMSRKTNTLMIHRMISEETIRVVM